MPSFAEAYGWRAAFVGLLPVLLVISTSGENHTNLKSGKEAKLDGPGKHSQSAGRFSAVSVKGAI